jgi:hypothetical protein
MATMHPSRVPDYVLRDAYREAEISVYEALRGSLPNEWHVFYSRPWLGLAPDGAEREGEADFVVAHPDSGLLVIEVKGGAVSRRPDTEEWVSRNRHGITNKIKDPAQQASRSKYALLAKLKEQPGWGTRFITARHGVVLPDCSPPRQALGANMPLWLFAFSEHLNNVGEWVKSRLHREDDEQDAPGRGLGEDGMRLLHRLLAGSFELRPSLARALRDDRREVERLTREQFEILSSLEGFSQMTVAGGAGTGKTLLALEKACRLAEDGATVLLICYNEALGDHLTRLTEAFPTVTVGSFHSVCGRAAQSAGIEVRAVGREFYERALPEALLEAVSVKEELKLDAVVVDEGQDFRDSWLTILRLCLKDSECGLFYVFHDDNQKIYSHSSTWLKELPQARYQLTRNLRNTRAIHLCVKPWYGGKAIRSAGPEGVPVEWHVAKRKEDLTAMVKGAVTDLIGRQKVPMGDIAILTGGRVDGNPVASRGMVSGHAFVSGGKSSNGRLVFDTVRRFKGLDRPVVLLIDVEELTEPELVYVALTRPSVLLMVFGTQAAVDRIKVGPVTEEDED